MSRSPEVDKPEEEMERGQRPWLPSSRGRVEVVTFSQRTCGPRKAKLGLVRPRSTQEWNSPDMGDPGVTPGHIRVETY